MAKNVKIEGKALRLSLISLISFSVLGIILGIVMSSEVIFFDGIYSLFGVLSSAATLKISQFIHKKDHFNFPFGKENLEPTVVIIQYLLLSFFLVISLREAINTILNGGNDVELLGVIIYLIVTTAILYVVVIRLRRMAKDSHSTLINSELIQWEISLRQSIFALVSYLATLALMWFSFNSILPYIDPAVLIVFIVLSFTTVIKELVKAFKELIGMKSISNQFHQKIENSVKQIVKNYSIKDYYLRVNKVGSVVVVEVDFLVDKDFKFGAVHQQDEIREEFEKSLSHIEYDLWLSIAFTTQYKWIT